VHRENEQRGQGSSYSYPILISRSDEVKLQGEFYEDTNVRSSAVFSQSEGQKDYSYVPETINEVN
jgi:hypothetical protein